MIKSKKFLIRCRSTTQLLILLFRIIACLFCCIPIVRCAWVAEETKERLTFLNFSDETIQVYWVDTKDPKLKAYRSVVVKPYQQRSTITKSNQVFTYRWGESRYTYTVESKSSIYPGVNDYNDDDIEEQIHIMGDGSMKLSRSEYESLVADHAIKKKTETVTVECMSRAGGAWYPFRIKVKPYWSPRGAIRFLELIEKKYYNGCALSRVVPEFVTQFGISPNSELRARFKDFHILDDYMDYTDNKKIPFQPGYLSFSGTGKHSRTAMVFIVMPNTSQERLDSMGENPWETPFGYIESKYLNSAVSQWYSGYGDIPPWGNAPQIERLYEEDAYRYLVKEFPKMSYIHECVIMDEFDVEYEKGMEVDEEL